VTRRQFVANGVGAALSATAFGALLSACGSGASGAANGPSGVIRWGIPQEPDTLDAQQTALLASWQVLQYLGNSIVHRNLHDQNMPGLASSWRANADSTMFEFSVRRGAVFHDGSIFDAHALQYTFERGLSTGVKSPIFPSQVGLIKTMTVVDPQTFRIELKQPYGPLIDNFGANGGSWLQPLSQRAVKQYGSEYGRHPVSTGPWKFTAWKTGQYIQFERSTAFRYGPQFLTNQGPPKTRQLKLVIVPDDTSRVSALMAGELDFAPIPATALAQVKGNSNITVIRQLQKGMGLCIHFNFKVPPFDDVRVRQAMHLVLDRKAIIGVAVAGQGIPAYGPLPPGFPYYWPGVEKIGYGYDPKRAAALLDAAGWKIGSSGVREKGGKQFRFDILTINTPEVVRAAQLVQQQMQALGMVLTLQTEDISAINPKLFAHDFQLTFMFWGDQDPDILYREFDSHEINGGGVNWGSYSNPTLDRYLEEGRATAVPAKRAAAYQKAQQLMVEQAVWLPIYATYDLTGVLSRLNGAVMHPDGYMLLDNATV
jgi:peptide/nickel transport system substrate-binding protein